MSLILNNISNVKEQVSQWKKQGLSVGLVPTMGALHHGHKTLIEKACTECDKVIVSIFVNPTQFGPNEDFNKYPRTLETDATICESVGVDAIFAPSASEMYPDMNTYTKVMPPEFYQNKLCGKSRPGHFDGVAVVVLKLFNITQADKAYFGLKDAQQLMIIEKMVTDLNISIKIVKCPLIRDEDGLATSSRNKYLSASERKNALCLNKILQKIKILYKEGETSTNKVKQEALKLLSGGVEIEYLDFYKTSNFKETSTLEQNTLVAIAAKVNNVRLIDNIILEN